MKPEWLGVRGWVAMAMLIALPFAWEASGLDLPLAQWMGGAEGFVHRDAWWLKTVLHGGGRMVAWGIECALCLALTWPMGPLRQLSFERRLQLALSVLLAAGVVAALKAASLTSCPWDLQAFGGMARYQSHWAGWRLSDGGAGHCFPAGQASAGFGFLGGWFALRRTLPGVARKWLVAALLFGLVLGLGQQLRGAHFMSHTLWTAWACGVVGWALDALFTRQEARHRPLGF